MPSAPGFELLPDAYSVVHDHELTTSAIEEVWGVLHNDTNAVSVSAVNGDANAIGQTITLPSGATLTMDDDGGFFYVPLASAAYVDQFSYTATDGALSASALVTISVTNAVPTVYDTTLSTLHDRDLRIYPEQIAWDDDFDALTMAIVSQPAVGSTVENEDGTYTFTPPEHWAGSTTLIVSASDGIATSNDAVLTINVTNNAPVATADEFFLHAGLILSLDATDGLMHNDYENDYDHVTAEIVGEWPDDGVLTFGTDGAISFDADQGFIGDVNLEYCIFDGVAYSATVPLIIHVENQSPQGTPDEWDVWYDQGISLGTANVLDNDWDDDHDELTAVLVSGPAYAQSFQLNADGSFLYVADSVTFVIQDTFSYKLFDGTSYSEPIEVTLHFTNSPLAKDDAYVLDENGMVEVDPEDANTKGVLANEFNPMERTLTAQLAEPVDPNDPNDPNAPLDPEVGTLDFRSDGSFTFTAGPSFQESLEFRYEISAIINNQPVSLGSALARIATETLLRASIGLWKVEFKSNAEIQRDDSSAPYNLPQWKDNNMDGVISSAQFDHQYPASFKKLSTIFLSSSFKIAPALRPLWDSFGPRLRVRATGPDGLAIGYDVQRAVHLQFVANTLVMYHLENGRPRIVVPMDGCLANQTAYYPSFQLDWQVSTDGGARWMAPLVAHTSRNEVFVTLDDPRGPLQPGSQLPTIRHTVLYAGANNGAVLQSELVTNIFNYFETGAVTRADGTQMKYWGSWDTTTIARTADSLIQSGDGICFAWAHFLIDVLRAQGGNISSSGAQSNLFEIRPVNERFNTPLIMVKHWSIPQPGNILVVQANALALNLGYTNFNNGNLNFQQVGDVWQYAWQDGANANVQRQNGIAGQNNPNPLATFTDHFVVQIGNTLYDPSYGVTYALGPADNRLVNFATAAVAGYALPWRQLIQQQLQNFVIFKGPGDPATTSARLIMRRVT